MYPLYKKERWKFKKALPFIGQGIRCMPWREDLPDAAVVHYEPLFLGIVAGG